MKNNGILPEREQISPEFKWKLEDIYKDKSSWEKDLTQAEKVLEKLLEQKGRLTSSAATLLECLLIRDKLFLMCDKLCAYAHMKKDQDNSNTENQILADKAVNFITRVEFSTAFIVPEITEMPTDKVVSFIDAEPGLSAYRHHLMELLRRKKHVLSEQEEKIMAIYSEIADAPQCIFTMLNNADLKFPCIEYHGKSIELTKGNYYTFMQDSNRKVRQDAFNALYSTYANTGNTFARMLLSSVKAHSVSSKLRKYVSGLEASLDGDKIGTEVYTSLIDTIHHNIGLMHRYMAIRKDILGLPKLCPWDLSVPLVPPSIKEVPYEDALSTVLDGLKPMGEQYCRDLATAFKSGWLDVYENRGKTSGAYSCGVYSAHPFILLNYQGNLNDVLTIAHEMGHAMHSFYTDTTQQYVNSHYKIFVAEVASTVNEILVLRHLLENSTEKGEKAYLINHFIDEFRATVFRQTMFAEFEQIIHDEVDNGGTLTLTYLNEIYTKLNAKYFGDDVELDARIALEWARIPHFYTSFYVYKYATGFSAAVALSEQILNGGANGIARYLEFLRSGGSDYPLALLKKAGVDLSTPEPVQAALSVFSDLIEQLTKLL